VGNHSNNEERGKLSEREREYPLFCLCGDLGKDAGGRESTKEPGPNKNGIRVQGGEGGLGLHRGEREVLQKQEDRSGFI